MYVPPHPPWQSATHTWIKMSGFTDLEHLKMKSIATKFQYFCLTLYLMTNFGTVQIESVCRWKNKND